MISKETLIKVANRENTKVGYKIPELGGLRRQFEPNEVKEIPMDELRKLSYLPGGKVLMSNYLIIENQEAIAELLGEVEPEYYYRGNDVERLLLEGSLDELKDCLDFAPQGVLDEIKMKAIKMQLNDMSKREAIQQALDFDIDGAIRIEKTIEEEVKEKAPVKKRRVVENAVEEDDKPKRRTTAPKYKIVR